MFKRPSFPALFSSPAYSWKRPSSVVNGGEASERVDVRQSEHRMGGGETFNTAGGLSSNLIRQASVSVVQIK